MGVGGVLSQGENGPRKGVGQGYRGNEGRLGGGESSSPPSAISQVLLQLNCGAQMKTGQCALLCAPLPQPASIYTLPNLPVQYN